MKLFKFLPFAFAIATMVGCNDDSFVEMPESNILEDGGSVNVNISMPIAVGSRTTEPGLTDGDAGEYEIKNATVVLFGADKKVVTSSAFIPDFKQESITQITSSQVINLDKGSTTPVYALALLNAPVAVTSRIQDKEDFSTIQSAIDAVNLTNTDGTFFMSNSTFYNTPASGTIPVYVISGENGIQSLQGIDPASISKSSTVAATSATNIYVERAAAKVDLEFFKGLTSPLANSDVFRNDDTSGLPTYTFTATGDQLVVGGWNLTTTSKDFYTVKKIETSDWTTWNTADTYQMTSHLSNPAWFRSYWGKSTNYGVDSPETDAYVYSSWNEARNESKEGTGLKAIYCTENTNIAGHQIQSRTTSVLINGVYTVAAKHTSETDVKDVYSVNGNVLSPYYAAEAIANAFKMKGYVKTDGSTESDLVGSDFLVSPSSKATNWKKLVKFDTQSATTSLLDKTTSTTAIEKAISDDDNYTKMDLLLLSVISYIDPIVHYPLGRCYYIVPIRHFDDTEVQLYKNPDAVGNKEYYEFPVGTPVAVNQTNQEGRYGVLRNHWYSVNIRSISQIGKPTPIDPTTPIVPPTTPDDEENLYLNAKINILPWAKRSQNADI